MVRLIQDKVILNADGSLTEVREAAAADACARENTAAGAETKTAGISPEAAGIGREKTMTWRILNAHNESGNMEQLRIRFDAMVSPDNNYVNILQTARASGMQKFPVPYVLSNCHNTLCAVGGTILEDDHVFGLSNAKKYGGIFVPPYRAVLHQYMREMMAGGGKMILGSDSHTRYGALGTMGIGEGGGELVKQLVGKTYDIAYPDVIAMKLTGTPRPGVGPMDVALAMIAKTFPIGFNKNKVLEVIGDGISGLSMEYRMGIDVMTTESAALSSIWCTDEKTRAYLKLHGREDAYRELAPEAGALYDGAIEIDLSAVEPMIALPFHPSNALPIREFLADPEKYLKAVEEEGNKIKGNHGAPFSILSHLRKDAETGETGFYPDQALISGCAGGLFENIAAAADILKAPDSALPGASTSAAGNAEPAGSAEPAGCSGIASDAWKNAGTGLSLHLNPASLPVMDALMRTGIASDLAAFGATMRPCICGPCFGVTDAPANNQLSIRHVTRNYPNREGSKPGQGQMAAVCLMDARSIAATVRNGGKLTAATDLSGVQYETREPFFNPAIYETQVFKNYEKGDPETGLVMGPNIADWPKMPGLKKHLLMKMAGSYKGSVTTDELLPSGESSSYRSNPERISEYTMISRDPDYRARAKAVRSVSAEVNFEEAGDITLGTLMVSDAIGDGSSREQAASNQRVLGGAANLANEYSTKRYRSNLINWGLLPFRTEEALDIPVGSWIFAEDIADQIRSGAKEVTLQILDLSSGAADAAGAGNSGDFTPEQFRALTPEQLRAHKTGEIRCTLDSLTEDERQILLAGCLMNYYRS